MAISIPNTQDCGGSFAAGKSVGAESGLGASATKQNYLEQIGASEGHQANAVQIGQLNGASQTFFDEAANRGSLPAKQAPFEADCKGLGAKC